MCFRILSTGVEFLLVRTRRGRWTFPKGGVEHGLTGAQSAAVEASEEAGVHGRIEETAFTSYQLGNSGEREGNTKFVDAHLCEVVRQEPPQEENRNPTWFSSESAKRRLAQGRSYESAAELARVVDRAVARIRRVPFRSSFKDDSLMKVEFEAKAGPYVQLSDRVSRMGDGRFVRLLPDGAADSHHDRRRGKVLELPPFHPDHT